MGANANQALALVLFLIAFVFVPAGMSGGGFLCYIAAVALLAASVGLFLKCKPWEHSETQA